MCSGKDSAAGPGILDGLIETATAGGHGDVETLGPLPRGLLLLQFFHKPSVVRHRHLL